MATGVELGVGYLSILPETSKLAPGIRNALSDSERDGHNAGSRAGKGFTGGISGSLKGAGALFAGAFAAIGAAQLFTGAISQASNLSESINAVTVSYGDAADGILNLSKTAAQGFGLSSSEFNGFAVQFQSFAKTIAGADGDVVGTFDSIIGRATDFASVMNLDVAEAATLFQSGLAGETEPLRRFGIDLSAASVEAYAYANGIAEAGTELTEAQKVQARYGSLLEQTAKTQGDFANTSDGLANQQRILGAEWENLKAKLGAAFVPAATAGLSWLSDDALPAIQWLADEVGPAADMVREFFGGFDSSSAAGGKMSEFAESVAQAWTSVKSIFSSGFTIVTNLWRLFGDNIIGYAKSALENTLQVLRGAFTFIQGIFNIFAGLLSGDWSRLWEGVKQVVSGAWSVITGLIGAAWNTIQFAFSNAGVVIGQIWSGIWEGIKSLASSAASFLIGQITAIPGRILGLLGSFKSAGTSLMQSFLDGLSKAGGFVADFANGVWGAVKKLINSGIDKINSALEFTIDLPGPLGSVGVNPTNIPHLAAGGYVTKPTLAVIGEAGPEIVLPLSSPHAPDWIQNGPTGGGGGMPPIQVYGAEGQSPREIAEQTFATWSFAMAGSGGVG